jgi:hypothetical protein
MRLRARAGALTAPRTQRPPVGAVVPVGAQRRGAQRQRLQCVLVLRGRVPRLRRRLARHHARHLRAGVRLCSSGQGRAPVLQSSSPAARSCGPLLARRLAYRGCRAEALLWA